uniref:Putative secreted peptide n=1 Tax=Anopheles braziliensis TaxID=58242 RepID=A0A2M3ZQW6_9DIPT
MRALGVVAKPAVLLGRTLLLSLPSVSVVYHGLSHRRLRPCRSDFPYGNNALARWLADYLRSTLSAGSRVLSLPTCQPGPAVQRLLNDRECA